MPAVREHERTRSVVFHEQVQQLGASGGPIRAPRRVSRMWTQAVDRASEDVPFGGRRVPVPQFLPQSGWQSDCNHSAIIYDRRRPPASRVRDRRETAARPLRPRAPPPRPQHLSPRFSQVHAAVFAGSRRGFAEIRPRNRDQIPRSQRSRPRSHARGRGRGCGTAFRGRDSLTGYGPRLTHVPCWIEEGGTLWGPVVGHAF